MNNRVRWRLGALAGAVALLAGLASFQAHALGLGRITVQSALGEPLRAEIDISEITPEEAASLRAGVASPESFKASGLEYSSALANLKVSVERRANGRSFLRLSSTRPVSEPFVDLVLEASWSSGRVVRDYTMLFDPPNLRQPGSISSAAAAPVAPILSRPPAPAGAVVQSPPASPPVSATAATPVPPAARPAPVARAVPAPPPTARSAAATGQEVTVKSGDTASKIANRYKPANISLDQMLVAMLRSNPQAFIGGNVNRIKSGAVIEIPDPAQVAALPASEASRTIVAQSRDFNDFRRKFAQNVPAAEVGAANRQAAGQVQAKVEDKTTAAVLPDKLTLSKGSVQGKAAADEKLVKDKQAQEASVRVAELAKNIAELNKISGATGAAAAGSAAKANPNVNAIVVPRPAALPASTSAISTATAPAATTATAVIAPPANVASAVVVPANTAVAKTATLAAVPASATPTATVAATTPSATATTTSTSFVTATVANATPVSSAGGTTTSTTAVVNTAAVAASAAAAKPAVPVVQSAAQPGLVEELMENPFVLPGLAALLLLLAGFGFYRLRQRNNPAQVDSSFLESRLQPDSFFGASGGQRIDTSEGGATGSSLVYSPSQLDAAGDVDPVAEADVYLAYGRDLQAEEILKEAIRTTPGRVAIHAKLMEIYAKRRDVKAFEVVAIEAFNLTRGEGPEWAYIGEMGRDLDPTNPMYQPGGQPGGNAGKAAFVAPESAAAFGFGASTIPQMVQPQHEEPSKPVDFDLDLDFSAGEAPLASAPTTPAPLSLYQPEPTVALRSLPEDPPIFDGLDMDFGAGAIALKPAPEPAQPSASMAPDFDPFADNGLTFTDTPPPAPAAKPLAAASPAVMDSGMLEFDLGSLSLNLDEATTESPSVRGNLDDNGPLETKFALAEEFRALGDMDGARSLAEEVLAQASGSLKNKAQAFLNALS